ncbi:MAG: hypothetical protein FDX30_08880 [Chlorobium sp.]|nr:MAG: hypothetical protein FDX30_08880 [Chlorobium sp.]
MKVIGRHRDGLDTHFLSSGVYCMNFRVNSGLEQSWGFYAMMLYLADFHRHDRVFPDKEMVLKRVPVVSIHIFGISCF